MNMQNTKLCPHCKSEINAKASRCPHCQGKIPRQVSKITAIIISIFAVVVMVQIFSINSTSTNNTTSTNTTTTTSQIRVGQEGYIRMSSGQDAIVASSKVGLSKLIDAAVAKDSYGMSNMILTAEAFFIKSGTKILVIGTSITAKNVRILEGQNIGLSGWLPSEFVSVK